MERKRNEEKRKREWSERTCLDKSTDWRLNRQAGRQTDALTKKTLRYAPGLRGISFASGDRKGVSPAMPGTQQHSQPVRRAGSA